jgi:hypothetical protein
MYRLLHLLVDLCHMLIRNQDDQQHHDDAQQGNNDVMIIFPGKCDHESKLRSQTGDLQIVGLTKS